MKGLSFQIVELFLGPDILVILWKTRKLFVNTTAGLFNQRRQAMALM